MFKDNLCAYRHPIYTIIYCKYTLFYNILKYKLSNVGIKNEKYSKFKFILILFIDVKNQLFRFIKTLFKW